MSEDANHDQHMLISFSVGAYLKLKACTGHKNIFPCVMNLIALKEIILFQSFGVDT